MSAAWVPPASKDRPDGFECLIWHEGRWRHVKWSPRIRAWAFGYGSAFTIDAADRLYAPLPDNTPETNNFWQGRNS